MLIEVSHSGKSVAWREWWKQKCREAQILVKIVKVTMYDFEFSTLESHLVSAPEISLFISTTGSSGIQKDEKYNQSINQSISNHSFKVKDWKSKTGHEGK